MSDKLRHCITGENKITEITAAVTGLCHTVEELRGRKAPIVFTDGNCADFSLLLQQALGEDIAQTYHGYVDKDFWVPGLVPFSHYFTKAGKSFVDINGQYDVSLYQKRHETMLEDPGKSAYQPVSRFLTMYNASNFGNEGFSSERGPEKKRMLQTSLILDDFAESGYDKSFDIERRLHQLTRCPYFKDESWRHGYASWAEVREEAKKEIKILS